jgi:shikimate kinase
MRLVFLYGPPGVGKLTIGRELSAMTGFRLFHNHLVVDLAASIFPHESEAYFRLLRRVRQDAIAEAASDDVDLVCTGVYRATNEQNDALRRLFEPIYASHGSVFFVQLTCARAEWLARVQVEARRPLHKLTDPQAVLDLLSRFDVFAAMPFEPHLHLDTTGRLPREVAEQVIRHFALPRQPERGV